MSFMKKLTDHLELIAQWHPIKNLPLIPEKVGAASTKKIWWKCSAAVDHEWIATPNDRTRSLKGSGCPCCSGKKAVPSNCLATIHPELAKEWHAECNGDLTPSTVTKGCNKKAWWIGSCGHEWEAVINARSRGSGCPYCDGKKVCKENAIGTTHPDLVKEWHPTKNGTLTPADVVFGTDKKIYWLGSCGHVWKSRPERRLRTPGRSGCPYCRKSIIDETNCLFVTHPKVVEQWHPTKNGLLTAKTVTSGHRRPKIWWQCEQGHEWQATVANRTNTNFNGTGCPVCRSSKGEQKIKDYLDNNNITYEPQKTLPGCKSKKLLRFDFGVFFKDQIYLIEYNGHQHYECIDWSSDDNKNRRSFESTVLHDQIKKKYCSDNKLVLIEIHYLKFEQIDQILDSYFETLA